MAVVRYRICLTFYFPLHMRYMNNLIYGRLSVTISAIALFVFEISSNASLRLATNKMERHVDCSHH